MSRVLFLIGGVFLVLGAVAWALERAGLRPGHLPGDIVTGSGNVRVYIPIATSILLSLILTGLAWIVGSLRR